MAFDLIVRGDLVLPDRVVRDGYLGVADGRIAALGAGEPPAGAKALCDSRGKLVLPGVVDGQVHAGSTKGIAGLGDATVAAAAGGVTTVVDMPFDDPHPANTVRHLEAKVDRIESHASVDVALYASPAKGRGTEGIAEMAEFGACAFKVSLYEYHPVRFPGYDMGELEELFPTIAETGLSVAFHNEDQGIVDRGVARLKAEGRTGPESHAASRPPAAETVANAAVFELALGSGVRAHIVHSTLARGFTQAAAYRALGAKTTAETCVQYLMFTTDDVLEQGARFKQQPPIRSAEERAALWREVAMGHVAFVSSDHVAWPLARKTEGDMFAASAGMPGLETLLPAFYTGAVRDQGLDVTTVARHLAEGPARHFGLYPRKGALTPRGDADFAILDPTPHTLDQAGMASEVKWSPYHGRELAGRVAATYLRGQPVFADGQVTARPGMGRFVRP